MEPGNLNITIYREAGFREHLVSYGPGDVPDNFTGFAGEAVLINKVKAEVLRATVVFGTKPGSFDIVIPQAEAMTLTPGVLDFYVNLLPPEGEAIRFLMGRATIV